ncbi:MAG: fibronectin type III domain-containing protein [Acidobacteriia bacterium]|nr:fibronectin type III domain-containing protein [Terriglobia bacterium]
MRLPFCHKRLSAGKAARIASAALVVFACGVNPAHLLAAGTITYVQSNYAVPQSPTATVSVTYTAAQVAGDLNVVAVGWNDSTAVVNTVTDNHGNIYTRAVGPTVLSGSLSQSIYYAKNIVAATAGSNIVTVTFSVAAVYPDVRIHEYSGADPNNPVDVTAAGSGNSATSATAAVTTTNATDLLFGANMVSTYTSKAGTGFTIRMNTVPDGDITEDEMVAATGSYTANAPLGSSGAWVIQLVAFRTASGDTTPPTTPTNLTATPVGTQINLSWTASTDNVAVTGYLVERCLGAGCTTFAQIATPATTSYSDPGLGAGIYNYRVRAKDAAGNLSPYSNVANGVIPDTQPPTTPTNLTATASGSQINLSWTASTDNVAVTGYLVERCLGAGCTTFAQIGTSATTSYSDPGLAIGSYSYRVRATDAPGNLSGYSNVASGTITDTTPPTAPTNLTATVSGTQINLSWTASTDNVGVTGYRVERCLGAGCTTVVQIATPTTTSYSDPSLGAGNYNYRVRATDAAGNLSPYSNVANGVIPDTQAPTTPTNLTATASGSQINLSWTASTDNVAVAGYLVERCLGAGCTTFAQIGTPATTSYSDPGLAVGNYSYRVRATDAAANLSPYSNVASSAITDTTPPTAPTNLTATVSGTQINLNWTASTDNVAVTGYLVERCLGAGCTTYTQIATPTTTSYSDPGLGAGNYNYRVRATDAAGNLSSYSNVANGVIPDTQAPTTPTNLTATASGSQINLSWTASTDNVAVTGYLVERCLGAGCATFAQIATPSGTTYNDTGLTAATSYSYRVRAADAANNLSPYSIIVTASTTSVSTPTAPTNLSTSAGPGPIVAAVQGYINSNSLASHTTLPFDSTGGDLIVMCASSHSGVTLSPSDSLGNTWISIAGPTSTTLGNDLRTQIWYARTPNVGPGHTVTISLSAPEALVISVIVVKGSNSSSPIETVSLLGSDNGTDTENVVSPNITITGANDLLIGWVKVSGGVAYTSGAGFTQQPGASSDFLDAETGLAAAPGTYSATFTLSNFVNWQSAVVAAANNTNQVSLSWTASTESGGTISKYLVERCQGAGCNSFAQIGTPTGASFTDAGLTASTSYSYRVRAQDAVGTVGPYSSAITFVTPPTIPSAPGNLTATPISGTQINLSWTASLETGGAISTYLVERCQGATCSNFAQIATPTSTTYSDTSVGSGSYNYRVRARDNAGNLSPYSNLANGAIGDTQPPTAPSNPVATPTSSSQISLTWTASTDNTGVTGYLVERCQGVGCGTFTQVATPAGTTYSDTGLAASTSYNYRVRATDAVGNLSQYSTVATATTPAPNSTITYVQSNYATPQSPTVTVNVTFTAAQTAGNLNVVAVGWNDTTAVINTVTDSRGNVYTRAVGPTVLSGSLSHSIYYAKNIVSAAAGANIVTVTFSVAAVYPDVRILEYRGADPNNPVDVTAAGSGNSATSTTGAVTTTNPTDLLFGANVVSSYTSNAGAGYTIRMNTNPNGDIAEDQMVAAIGSYTASAPLGSSGGWVIQMVAFRTPSTDSIPPTTPTNLSATAVSGSQINLSWTASTDNVGVTGYLIERCQGVGCTNFGRLLTVAGTTYSDTTLVPNTSYTYQVKAQDAAGNFSSYSNQVTTTTLTTISGLLAAYSFNEGAGTTVTDLSGNGNTGTLTNTAWTASGKYGNGLVFNGTNSLVTINDSASLHLTTGMTLEAWVNPSTVSSAMRDVIYKSNDNYYLEATTNHTGLPGGGGTFGATDVAAYGTAPLAVNSWTHLAITYDGAALSLYVNGLQVATLAQSGTIATSTNPLQIGGDTNLGQFFSGVIDEVRLYRVALTQAQILSDMNTALGGTGSLPIVNLSTSSLSFGNQGVGTSSGAQPVTLTNVGGANLAINSIGLSGGNTADFSQTNNCPATLAATNFCTINVTFAPTTTGSRNSSVVINDNASGSPHTITLSGTGTGAGVTVTPRVTVLTFTGTQQFNASTGGVTWSVDGSVGGSPSAGTITSTGLYTPPNSTGTHTVTATTSDQSQSGSATVYISNYPGTFTYHNDNLRTGQNLGESVLTPSNVNQSQFGKLFSYGLDGMAFASPLYVANVNIPSKGLHNVVYVATEHDSVYAFDADGLSTTPLWQTSFLKSGVTTVPCADVGECGDIPVEIGITGTPAIDQSTGTIYVVAKTKESGSYFYRLHALDITTGAEKFGGPVVLQGSILGGTGDGAIGGSLPFISLRENQRPGLLLNNGVVYIGFASHGDNNPWHGWVLGYSATTLQQVMIYCVSPDGYGGGVWQSGGGLGADASANIYFTTGNGDFTVNTGGRDYGDSVVKIAPTGSVVDYFTPHDQANMEAQNFDLSSAGPVLLVDQPGPTPHLMITAAKTGTIYVLNRDNMGHFNSSSDNQIVQALVGVLPHGGGEEGNYSAPVFFNNYVYFAAVNDNLKAFRLTSGLLSGAPTSQSTVTYPNRGGSFAISANGSNNGILWALQDNSPSGGVLHAYDASNLASELYNSSQAGARDALDIASKFNIPLVANGKVFVASNGFLTTFGLLP